MRGPRAASFVLLALTVLPGAGWLFAQQEPTKTSAGSQTAAVRNRVVHDGNWWLRIGEMPYGELTQSGFLDGVSDYLVTVSRVKWLVGSTDYGVEKITGYYNRDPRNRSLLVPEVWRRVLTESPPPPALPGGEVYDGPHGYYDGSWYKMGDIDERIAYLDGYLWCRRTYGKQPAAAYPRSLDYYDQKIWNYIKTPKAYNEPVADILARFRSAIPN